jgi:hypothetical protein
MSAHEVKLREIRAAHGREYTLPFKGNPAIRLMSDTRLEEVVAERSKARGRGSQVTIENVTLRSAYQKIR